MSNSSNILSYKKLNCEYIDILAPNKVNGVYQSDILYNNKPWFVQVPDLQLNSSSSISFSMVKKGTFFTFLEQLEEKIITTLSSKSVEFFNGKSFSENKIKDTLVKPYNITTDGLVILNGVSLDSGLQVYDYFKDQVCKLPNYPFCGTCILKIGPIKWNKNVISLDYKICYIKLPFEKKKITKCILDSDDEDVTQHSNTSSVALQTESNVTQDSVSGSDSVALQTDSNVTQDSVSGNVSSSSSVALQTESNMTDNVSSSVALQTESNNDRLLSEDVKENHNEYMDFFEEV